MGGVRRLLPWLLLITPLALLPFGACGGPDPGAADGAVDSAIEETHVPDARPDAPACVPPVFDGGIPDGWVADESFSKCCPFFRPPGPQAFPPPLEWEACPSRIMGVLPSGTKCKSLKVTWNPPKTIPGASGQGYVDRDSGNVFLSVVETIDSGYFLLHAEGEGAIRAATFVPSNSPCRAAQGLQTLSSNAWGVEVYDPNGTKTKGILAGTDLSMASTLAVPIAGGQHTISTGNAGVLDMDTDLVLYDPNHPDAGGRVISAAKDLEAIPNFFEDSIAWIAEGAVSMKIRLYHAGTTVDFIDYSTIDIEHGAGCLGGDGKDMVWVEGFGLESAGRYKTAAYFTSPYTTDASKLQPRRLRSDSYRVLDTVPTIVGCGYAARSEGRNLRLVRISDGVSWFLPASSTDAGFDDAIVWSKPFAITCSEVWVQTERIPVRIDIASLGPGIPPD